ncbi:MAG: hypothetical protein Q7T30_02065, partial [Planctomycetota bacterium]|nr:hypothetical protein [Planctomycetota bacterium]
MGTARGAVIVVALLGAAPAQQTAQLFECADIARRLGENHAQAKGEVRPIERLASLVRHLLHSEGPGAKPAITINAITMSSRIVARCSPDEMGVVKGVLEQLRVEHLPRARLQCSLLTMPAALVKAHGLTADTFAPTDETAFGKLVRDAVKQKGALQNLPEVIAEPLVPFVVEPAAKPDKPAPGADPTLRMRGEMVPVRPGEVAFGMQLVRGALPDDRTQVPKDAILQRA